MKALVCANCLDIRALDPEGGWVECRCGNLRGRWVDPLAGTAEFDADNRAKSYVLGLHNGMLTGILRQYGEHDWDETRALHDVVTHQPGYVFDKEYAGCWAVMLPAGTTADVSWLERPTQTSVGT